MPVTIGDLIDLHENASRYRYARDLAERRRPPTFATLLSFAQATFGHRLAFHVDDWTYQGYRKTRRIRTYVGKLRHGKRLSVSLLGHTQFSRDHVLAVFNTADPVYTGWHLVEWIVAEHRREKAKAADTGRAEGGDIEGSVA